MRSLPFVLCSLSSIIATTGCSADREAALIGQWRASATYAAATVFQMKQQDPSASGKEVLQAAKVLGTTGIELRQDKTFLMVLGAIMEGTWTFDKELGELELKINKASQLDGTPAAEAEVAAMGTWLAYLEPGNDLLRLFPAPRESVELIKKSKGPMSKGIPLRKNAE